MEYTTTVGDTVVTIRALSMDGQPWLHAFDVARSLGYGRNVQGQVLQRNVRPAYRRSLHELAADQAGQDTYISELGFHSLAAKCPRTELATSLQEWCLSELFPLLRAARAGEEPRMEEGILATTSAAPAAIDQTWAARHSRCQALLSAHQLAESMGLPVARNVLQRQAEEAVADVLLPEGRGSNDYADAAQILRERGFTEPQIARLAGEFGRDLLLCAGEPHERAQTFGNADKNVRQYHREKDAALIADTLASFQERPLFKRVMAGAPSAETVRRQRLLAEHGRGRPRQPPQLGDQF
jgi:prophage antirepressor-like protein